MPLRGAGCKLDRCKPVKACMRASRVVVATPVFDDPARLLQASEQVLVQALIAKTPDKAFCKPILHGLARRDVVPLDPAFRLPLQDRVRGQLRAVVADDKARIAAEPDEFVQFTGDTDARD